MGAAKETATPFGEAQLDTLEAVCRTLTPESDEPATPAAQHPLAAEFEAFVAAELAAAGDRVVVLEKGGYFREADFDGAERRSTERLFEKRGVLTTRDAGVVLLAGSNLGGGTTVNWMTSLRTPDSVVREWET